MGYHKKRRERGIGGLLSAARAQVTREGLPWKTRTAG